MDPINTLPRIELEDTGDWFKKLTEEENDLFENSFIEEKCNRSAENLTEFFNIQNHNEWEKTSQELQAFQFQENPPANNSQNIHSIAYPVIKTRGEEYLENLIPQQEIDNSWPPIDLEDACQWLKENSPKKGKIEEFNSTLELAWKDFFECKEEKIEDVKNRVFEENPPANNSQNIHSVAYPVIETRGEEYLENLIPQQEIDNSWPPIDLEDACQWLKEKSPKKRKIEESNSTLELAWKDFFEFKEEKIEDVKNRVNDTVQLNNKIIGDDTKTIIELNLYLDSARPPYLQQTLKILKNPKFGLLSIDKNFRYSIDQQIQKGGFNNEKIIKLIFEYIYSYYNTPFIIFSDRKTNNLLTVIGSENCISGINKDYEKYFGKEAWVFRPGKSYSIMELKNAEANPIMDLLYSSEIYLRQEFYSLLHDPEKEPEICQKVLPLLSEAHRSDPKKEQIKEIIEALSMIDTKILKNQEIIKRFYSQLLYMLMYKKF